MSHVKSIICFNGGSGGDFLKAICLTQFDYLSFSFEDNGIYDNLRIPIENQDNHEHHYILLKNNENS